MWTKIKRLLGAPDKPEQHPTETEPAPTQRRIRKYRFPGPSRIKTYPPKRTDGIIPPLTPPPKSDRAEKAS